MNALKCVYVRKMVVLARVRVKQENLYDNDNDIFNREQEKESGVLWLREEEIKTKRDKHREKERTKW